MAWPVLSSYSLVVLRVCGLLTNKQIPFSIIIKEDGRSPVGMTDRKTTAVWDSQPFTVSYVSLMLLLLVLVTLLTLLMLLMPMVLMTKLGAKLRPSTSC